MQIFLVKKLFFLSAWARQIYFIFSFKMPFYPIKPLSIGEIKLFG